MSENINLMKVLQRRFQKLSKGQKIIAQYIMKNYDKAAFMTAAKLGEVVGVSESTVVRFAITIGYEGYPQLQKQLQEMVRTKLTTVQRIEMSTDYSNQANVLKTILKSDMENIRGTMEEIDGSAFEQAVNAIIEAKSIYIIGLRSSNTLSEFLGFYLNFLRDNIHVVTYTIGDIFEQLFRIGKDDLVIGITFPRYSARTLKAFEYAKSRGAKTIAITDSLLSPLCTNADYTLIAKSNMESFVDSIVAPMSVLNALIVAVGIKEKQNISDSFARLEDIWNKYNIFSADKDE
ncbi:MAG TPA: MurR/RpiR family transcriptional regulator [Bacillota bacterium]|nr:MurR/RpiR family transcriptional regulator [Bacillota bacterium]HRU41899.1 MurR/RpiR family transcriptional regulator [Candidatus Diapherotrites archaeon]HQE65982.1 MurR/RpiR family transcriptional regulator [Bacillota bacterium]HQI15882.1 MurR/RpiR family transcriptional regulator [Bacillota bacterium]HQJ36219.1 MurR/RpiR family transcriptional regulator [Bacillota bacterium]